MKLNGRRLTAPILAILIVLSALALIFGVVMGSTGLKLSELSLLFSPSTEPSAVILRSVRLPRTILSYLVGGGLAVAGCCLQGVFKNPMADSHILGVSSGAGFGAAVAMTMGAGAGLSLYGLGGIAAFAFAGGLLCVMLVFFASRVKSRISTTSLLLAGIALSSLFSALTSAIMILNRGRLDNIFMWLLGSFSSASYSKVLFATVSILPVSAGLMLFSRPLNVMLLGEEEARMLGVDYSRHLRIIILLATVLAPSCVAVSRGRRVRRIDNTSHDTPCGRPRSPYAASLFIPGRGGVPVRYGYPVKMPVSTHRAPCRRAVRYMRGSFLPFYHEALRERRPGWLIGL